MNDDAQTTVSDNASDALSEPADSSGAAPAEAATPVLSGSADQETVSDSLLNAPSGPAAEMGDAAGTLVDEDPDDDLLGDDAEDGNCEETRKEPTSLEDILRSKEGELAAAQDRAAEASRTRRLLRARQLRANRSLESVDSEVAELRSARESLNSWVGARAHSYSWKLLSTLQGERDRAGRDLADLRAAASSPLGGNLEPPSKLQDRFMWKAIGAFGLLLSIFALVTTLKYRLLEEASQVAAPINPMSWPTWLTGAVLLLIYLGLLVRFLITYYRETSQRRHALTQLRSHLDYLEQTGRRIREEDHRLDSLHTQVPGYLKYLSEVLHRPWEIPAIAIGDGFETSPSGLQDTPEQIVFDTTRPSTDSLPSLMRLAEPPPGSGGAKEQALVRDTVQQILRPGWRFDSLVQLLRSIERDQSLPEDTLAPRRVDQDPRLREAVLASLERSEVRRDAGRSQLRHLSRQIQLLVLEEVHPPVKDLARDALDGLLLDEDMLGDADRALKDWDAFLAESLGPASRWGALNFNLAGLMAADAEDSLEVVAYGPDRLQPMCHESTTLRGFSLPSVRPIELVVRIERTTRALGPAQLKVFDGTSRQGVNSPTPSDAVSEVSSPPTTVLDGLDGPGGALA